METALTLLIYGATVLVWTVAFMIILVVAFAVISFFAWEKKQKGKG